MKVGILREIVLNERRVALVPNAVSKLTKEEYEVLIEAEAGRAALVKDTEYQEAGARVLGSPEEVYGEADIILKVRPPVIGPLSGKHEVEMMRRWR
jgi:alanine dehydrogenase